MLKILNALRRRGEWIGDWIDAIEPDASQEIIFTATGGLLRVAAYEPPDVEAAGRDERQFLADRAAELLTMPGTGYSAWIDKWHLEDTSYLDDCDFAGNRAAQLVDASRRRQFVDLDRPVFRDRHFLAIHQAPQQRDAARAIVYDQDASSVRERLRNFVDQTDQFYRGLSLICPSVRVMSHKALGTAMALPLTYRYVETPLPAELMQLAYGGLADWDTDFQMVVDGLHVEAVEVHAFGSITPETVEALHELRFPYRWTNTIHFLDPDQQRAVIQWDRKRWEPKQYSLAGWVAVAIARDRSYGRARPDVMVALAELDELESGLHVQKDGLGIASMTIRVWSHDRKVAQDRAQDVASILNAGDLRARVSTFPSLGAVADIYGNASRDLVNRRKLKAHLSKMAKCSPLTGLTSGHREDSHLGARALLAAMSRRHGTLFVPLHAPGSDVGHTAVIGPTGGGKSALLSTAAAMYHAYAGGTVTMFDKRCSAMVATLCLGGTWLEFGTGGIAVQPLRMIDTEAGFTWAIGWLQEALKLRNVIVNSRVDAALTDALISVRDLGDPDRWTISALCAHLGGDEETLQAMSHYTAARGPFRSLFDGVVPGYGNSRMLTIEYDAIMQPNFPEGALAFAACFHAIERERLSGGGHPKLVMIDEAWQPLGHPLFRGWIADMALTGRKLNMQLVICTQSVRHLDDEHTAILMEQCPQKVFTANPSALQEVNAERYRGIGLTDDQVALIATLQPKREYLFQTPTFTRVGRLELEDDALRICGSSRPVPDVDRARKLLAEGATPETFLERWMAPWRSEDSTHLRS